MQRKKMSRTSLYSGCKLLRPPSYAGCIACHRHTAAMHLVCCHSSSASRLESCKRSCRRFSVPTSCLSLLADTRPGLLVFFPWRRPARLQHLLEHAVALAADRLVLGRREVAQHVCVPQVRRQRIAVLVDGPLAVATQHDPPRQVSARQEDERAPRDSTYNLVVSAWPVPTYLACRCSH
jgi:hypothetical protein